MKDRVTIQELAAALIAVFEGNKLKAYQDSGGVWTVGIGHTLNVKEGMEITAEQAAVFFAQDEEPLLRLLSDMPVLEGAALASFGFNCGLGALRKVLAGQDLVTSPRHSTDRSGKVLAGLVNRRRLEELLRVLSQQYEADLRRASIMNPHLPDRLDAGGGIS